MIQAWASIAGKKESEGPLAHTFDVTSQDTYFGQKTWEQAEKYMQQLALDKVAEKAGMKKKDFDLVLSGDLLNQCIGSSFSLRNTSIPHLGLYGACSTMAESLLIASMIVGGGFVTKGAHNVIEPLALRKPVIVGPHIWTIAYPAHEAIAAGVCKLVPDEAALLDAVRQPVAVSPEQITAFYNAHAGAVARTLAALNAAGLPAPDGAVDASGGDI